MAELIAEISKLSIAERIRLVQEILATIRLEEEAEKPGELTDSQIEEMEKRSVSIANGTAKTVSWDNIEKALIERYDL